MGIAFQVDATWFVVFFLITLSLTSRFAQEYPHWGMFTYWTVGLLTSLLFFASVILHELAHSVVAIAKGIPVRSITLFIFGGIAQISREANRPSTEFQVAVAGPGASLLISLFFAGVWLMTRGSNEILAALSGWLGQINLILALFNLIPGFPLDGGRILRSMVWAISGDFGSATRVATLLGKVVAYLFILIGIWLALEKHFFDGLWVGFVGWFLLKAAHQSYQQLMLKESIAGIKATDLMNRDCPRISPTLSLRAFLQDEVPAASRHCFLVISQDQLQGIVTLHEINRIPRDRWEQVSVEDVMIPLQGLRWVKPNQNVVKILEYMNQEDIHQVPVIAEGQLLGVVGRQEILHLLQSRFEASA